MERVAKFEKISYEQFKKDWASTICELPEEKMQEIYNNIKVPTRATARSAGYDFYLPTSVSIDAGSEMTIPTGIRCRMEPDYALIICPKSGLGSKFRFQLNNTLGLIDADYYYSDNEGHMFCKVINDNRQGKQLVLEAGAKFVQGFFFKYGITEDDSAVGDRNGGFGSTGK
ncbi:MAG: deoxyuridine 5'-triphosphate nucleotidohydrolase [Clostridia bacterium]|nr:deoxyuridine 5'-triphosphate nucleotidohydrolase [Clostridia bacterium]